MFVPAPNSPFPWFSILNGLLSLFALLMFYRLISKFSPNTFKSFGIRNLVLAGAFIVSALMLRSLVATKVINIEFIPLWQAALIGYVFSISVAIGSFFFVLSALDILKTLEELRLNK